MREPVCLKGVSERSPWIRYARSSLLLVFVFFVGLVIFACGPSEQYVGTYKAIGDGSPPQHTETAIELKEGGQGVWSTHDAEVTFRWSVRGNEIRLHTKEGGIVTGTIKNDTLEIALPGGKTMSFKKSQG